MATYKKRTKKTTKKQSIEQRSSTAKFFAKLDYNASALEDWVSRNKKGIFGVLGVVVVAVFGYMAYINFVLNPRQAEATKQMSQSIDYFERAMTVDAGPNQDTLFMKALNGAGSYGLLDIIENYGGTDAANLAEYSAGMAYLKLGQYQNAIDHLQNFSSDDVIYPAVVKGALGDAYLGLKQADQALQYYSQAATVRTNNFTTPKFLLKAAIVALQLNKADQAEGFLKRITEEFPDSQAAAQAPAYLGMAQAATK